MSTIEYLKGISKPPSSGSGVGLGQAYHEKGFIRLHFGLGFESCGAGGNNCYGFSYPGGGKGNSVTITERPAGSTGSGTVVWSSSWSSLDYDYLSTTGNGYTTNGIWYLGKDQNIQQSDGLHEYSVSVSVKDSHDGTNGGSIYWIPSPPPPPGPIVTLRNKTGHFHSTGPVSIEIMAYPLEECSEGNVSHVMISVDGGAWANANSFPVLETISGIGSHNIKVKGVTDADIIGKTVDYSFSIGTNDWRPEVLTPIKTIVHKGENDAEWRTANNTGWANFYAMSADVFTEDTFTPNVSFHECYANATTKNLSSSSGASFDVYLPNLQSDGANNYTKWWVTTDPDSNTFIEFGDLTTLKGQGSKKSPLDYFTNTDVPPVKHELGVFIGSFNGLTVYDECTIPDIVTQSFDMASAPNANNEYEFTDAGLKLNVYVERIIHQFPEQYYHIHYPVQDYHVYSALEADVPKQLNILPSDIDTSVKIELFNGCGDIVSKTFQLKYIGSGLGSIGQTTGSGPTSTVTNITTNTVVGSKPGNHSLLVNKIGD